MSNDGGRGAAVGIGEKFTFRLGMLPSVASFNYEYGQGGWL